MRQRQPLDDQRFVSMHLSTHFPIKSAFDAGLSRIFVSLKEIVEWILESVSGIS